MRVGSRDFEQVVNKTAMLKDRDEGQRRRLLHLLVVVRPVLGWNKQAG